MAHHAEQLADRFCVNKELAIAAAMLHDIADTVMKREHPNHEVKSLDIARELLRETGFTDGETRIVVDDAIKFHGCHDGNAPQTLEGKVMATADALTHLEQSYYDHAVLALGSDGEPVESIRRWVFSKLDRDFNRKILFAVVKEETRPQYEKLISFFSRKFAEG